MTQSRPCSPLCPSDSGVNRHKAKPSRSHVPRQQLLSDSSQLPSRPQSAQLLVGSTSGSCPPGGGGSSWGASAPAPPLLAPAHGWYMPLERGRAWEPGDGTGGGRRGHPWSLSAGRIPGLWGRHCHRPHSTEEELGAGPQPKTASGPGPSPADCPRASAHGLCAVAPGPPEPLCLPPGLEGPQSLLLSPKGLNPACKLEN